VVVSFTGRDTTTHDSSIVVFSIFLFRTIRDRIATESYLQVRYITILNVYVQVVIINIGVNDFELFLRAVWRLVSSSTLGMR